MSAQRVGVVLSGGGATAIAHVGFLRVLEENGIPIDYIGGTSMGAVIAAMYASGESVGRIDSLVRSRDFLNMATGRIEDKLRFYYTENDKDASMATIKYNKGKFITNAIPTNLINPAYMDWKFMEGFSQADAASGYQFDSLFIPFRCIAADVEHKSEIVFRKGPLSVAARASCTYPFYIPARRVDGALLFDGGIYNNFPADMIYREFMPDVILGCNVSEESVSPDEDDLLSQIESLILFREVQQTLCEQMFVVRPDITDVGTFDFDQIAEAIDKGYEATMAALPEIEGLIERRVDPFLLNERRKAFKARFPEFVFDEMHIDGLDKSQNTYVRKLIGKKQADFRLNDIRVPYFRLIADEKIKSIYPIARYSPDRDRYRLFLDIRKEKDLFLSFGGNFSSRSINTGFVGLRYNFFGKTAATLHANSYFGRFYGSIHANLRWEISTSRVPVAFQLSYTQNRWDYYKSLAFFFEDVKPSFILLNERVGTVSAIIPSGNKGVVRADASYAYMFDQYYQTRQFVSTDRADQTDFSAGILRLTWERSTLNRRQYPSKGTYTMATAKMVSGLEATLPGTTSVISDTTHAWHQWGVARFTYQNYFFRRGIFHLGLMVDGVMSSQDFFQNYISSSIAASSFRPTPESQTLFMPQFRAHSFVAGGMIAVFELRKNIDLRAESYVFNAFGRILSTPDLKPRYDYNQREFYIGSGSLVFHSPIGPISISANYYDQKEVPWSFIFNLGYIVFNRSARD